MAITEGQGESNMNASTRNLVGSKARLQRRQFIKGR